MNEFPQYFKINVESASVFFAFESKNSGIRVIVDGSDVVISAVGGYYLDELTHEITKDKFVELTKQPLHVINERMRRLTNEI